MQVCHLTSHGKYIVFTLLLLVISALVMSGPYLFSPFSYTRAGISSQSQSVWVWRSAEGAWKVTPAVSESPKEIPLDTDFTSSFILPPEQDESGTVYTKATQFDSLPYKTIAKYDPGKVLPAWMRTNFSACEYNKCKTTSSLETADAVVFMVARLTRIVYKGANGKTMYKPTPLPDFKRKRGQRWIMQTDEAPSRFSWFKSLDRDGMRDVFNWTITHRLEGDITHRYGYLVPRLTLESKDYAQLVAGKTEMAAWFVSHCPVRSRRADYVNRMKTRMEVDIFGMCGTKECGTAPKGAGITGFRDKSDTETCLPMLSQTYKFYLAFENSLCQEYVTEKFFKLFNGADIIPVVRGGADYKSYFPPGTYVDASDFSTPEALADFLVDLGNDKLRYENYLRRKDRYRRVKDFPEIHCKICKKLHTDKKRKTYRDIHQWWTAHSCHDDVVDSRIF